jgi:hypothetical protein
MLSEARILIFGLDSSDSAADVRVLLRGCGDVDLDICTVPGDSGQVFAVVHLNPDRELAWRLADRIRHSRWHGRRLQTWVPAMPWV